MDNESFFKSLTYPLALHVSEPLNEGGFALASFKHLMHSGCKVMQEI
jgi:hypothetical protein